MKLLILSLIILTCACGAPPRKYLHKDIYNVTMTNATREYKDPEIMGYVNDFLDLCHDNGVVGDGSVTQLRTVEYNIPDTGDGSYGSCALLKMRILIVDKEEYRNIKIHPDAKAEGPFTLRSVIYHEAAHCVYEIDHLQDEASLMAEVSPSEEYLAANLDAMAETLAKRIASGDYPRI